MNIFALKKDFSPAQLYGAGLAAILICLIVAAWSENIVWIYAGIGLVILLMVWPAPFRYFAMGWFALGELLGFVVSKIILGIIYALIVIPIGILVRGSIRKRMHLSHFRKSTDSVFKNREHVFSASDFEKPF